MVRPKKIKEEVVKIPEPIHKDIIREVKIKPTELSFEFGNGDLNVLKSKINEIIKFL